jgi:hypothetical protein
MSALAYLDLHYLRNAIGAILRSPGRLALWLPYLAVLGYFAYARAGNAASAPHTLSSAQLSHPMATAIGGAFLGMLGFGLLRSGGSRVASFRSPAEAVLFANAGITPRALVTWLQVRRFASTGPRWIAALVCYIAAFAPGNAGLGELGRMFVASLIAAAVLTTVELPAFLAQRRGAGWLVVAAAWGTIALGFAYAIGGAAILIGDEGIAPAVLRALHADPAHAVFALVEGPPLATLAFAALPLLLVAVCPLLSRDAFPEFYAATLETHAMRERIRGGGRLDARTVSAGSGARIPPGALALVWKDWVALRRRRYGLWPTVLAFLFWAAIGSTIAFTAAGDPSLGYALLGFAGMFVLFVPAAVSHGLIAELSKPIWWLSRSSLRARLAAWTFARSWRGAVALAGLPLAMGVLAHSAGLTLAAFPAAAAAWWSLYGLGLLLYAAFPSRADMRGPVALLRFMATAVFLVPPAVMFVYVASLAHSGAAAVAASLGLLVAQGALALEIAVRRIETNGAALVTLERA